MGGLPREEIFMYEYKAEDPRLAVFYRENSFTATLRHQKRLLYGRLQDGKPDGT